MPEHHLGSTSHASGSHFKHQTTTCPVVLYGVRPVASLRSLQHLNTLALLLLSAMLATPTCLVALLALASAVVAAPTPASLLDGAIQARQNFADTTVLSDAAKNDVAVFADLARSVIGRAWIVNAVERWRADRPPFSAPRRFSQAVVLLFWFDRLWCGWRSCHRPDRERRQGPAHPR